MRQEMEAKTKYWKWCWVKKTKCVCVCSVQSESFCESLFNGTNLKSALRWQVTTCSSQYLLLPLQAYSRCRRSHTRPSQVNRDREKLKSFMSFCVHFTWIQSLRIPSKSNLLLYLQGARRKNLIGFSNFSPHVSDSEIRGTWVFTFNSPQPVPRQSISFNGSSQLTCWIQQL